VIARVPLSVKQEMQEARRLTFLWQGMTPGNEKPPILTRLLDEYGWVSSGLDCSAKTVSGTMTMTAVSRVEASPAMRPRARSARPTARMPDVARIWDHAA